MPCRSTRGRCAGWIPILWKNWSVARRIELPRSKRMSRSLLRSSTAAAGRPARRCPCPTTTTSSSSNSSTTCRAGEYTGSEAKPTSAAPFCRSARVWSVLAVVRKLTSTPGWARMKLSKRGAKRWTKAWVAAAARTRPAGSRCDPASAVAQRVGLVEDAPRIVEGGLARLRQPHPPLRPDEEGLAQLLLEGLDLVAHRRLGEIEALGGAGEVEGVGDLPERAQLRHLHLWSPPLAA